MAATLGEAISAVEQPVRSHRGSRERVLRDWMERDKLLAASSVDVMA